jgi:small ligand-binding sensory domain FIST
MNTAYSIAAHYDGGFDVGDLEAWASGLRNQFTGEEISLGFVFATPPFFDNAAELLEILRVHARIPLLIGCSSGGLIANAQELEKDSGVVLSLHHLPKASLKAIHFTQEQVEQGDREGFWREETGVSESNGWLVFADPFQINAEQWLEQWNINWPFAPVLGGLASGSQQQQRTQVYLNGDVYEEGGVALSVGGSVALSSVISQGCTPIGETWTITRVEDNVIHEIGNRPAYEVLVETFESLSDTEKEKTKGNLFVGMVIDEYLDEFHRGDFLIRNLIGVDPNNGAIAVGALPRVGQTLQFQRRDARAAGEDFDELLHRTRESLEDTTVYGGCLCCCNGRGKNLFEASDHDAGLVQHHLGDIGLSGFFCNGEIGPVGQNNYLHGYTASLALFVEKADA